MEGDLLSLDLPILDIDLVAHETDRDAFTDPSQVLVPLGDVLVGDPRTDIEHDDATLPANVVAFSEPAKLLLSSSIPNIELDGTMVGVEDDGVHIDTSGGDVLLLELTGEVPLDEGCLTDTAITDHNELELCLRLHGFDLLDVLLGELVLWDSLRLLRLHVSEVTL